jgi:nucleotide-binding universal stress UspA family protein
MSIKNILVHLKANEDWSPHIDYALEVAAYFKAKIVGLIIFDDIAVLRKYVGRDSHLAHERAVQKAIHDQHLHNQQSAAALKARFERAAAQQKLGHDFVVVEGRSLEVLPWAARYHDLAILEQPDAEKEEAGHEAAEETALSAGRPLILVPPAGNLVPKPETLLFAWNASPEAAAAMQGALPFLAIASRIVVLVGGRREHAHLLDATHQFDIAASLKQHVKEVVVEAVVETGEGMGAFILDRARANGAQMIIMGAYGRSRLSELILGGATRYMFRHTTIPVLMGH